MNTRYAVMMAASMLAACAQDYTIANQAYSLYRQGTIAFDNGHYDTAEQKMLAATSYLGQDNSQLLVDSGSEYSSLECAKKCYVSREIYGNRVEYYPNEYLAKIRYQKKQLVIKGERLVKLDAPPRLKAELRLEDLDGNRILDAGETGMVNISVQNIGESRADELMFVFQSKLASLSIQPSQYNLASLEVGEKRHFEVSIKNHYGSLTQEGMVTMLAKERDQSLEGNTHLSLSTTLRAYRPPNLALTPLPDNKPITAGVKTMQEYQLCNHGQQSLYDLSLGLDKKDIDSNYSKLEPEKIRLIKPSRCLIIQAYFRPDITLQEQHQLTTGLIATDGNQTRQALHLNSIISYASMEDLIYQQP